MAAIATAAISGSCAQQDDQLVRQWLATSSTPDASQAWTEPPSAVRNSLDDEETVLVKSQRAARKLMDGSKLMIPSAAQTVEHHLESLRTYADMLQCGNGPTTDAYGAFIAMSRGLADLRKTQAENSYALLQRMTHMLQQNEAAVEAKAAAEKALKKLESGHAKCQKKIGILHQQQQLQQQQTQQQSNGDRRALTLCHADHTQQHQDALRKLELMMQAHELRAKLRCCESLLATTESKQRRCVEFTNACVEFYQFQKQYFEEGARLLNELMPSAERLASDLDERDKEFQDSLASMEVNRVRLSSNLETCEAQLKELVEAEPQMSVADRLTKKLQRLKFRRASSPTRAQTETKPRSRSHDDGAGATSPSPAAAASATSSAAKRPLPHRPYPELVHGAISLSSDEDEYDSSDDFNDYAEIDMSEIDARRPSVSAPQPAAAAAIISTESGTEPIYSITRLKSPTVAVEPPPTTTTTSTIASVRSPPPAVPPPSCKPAFVPSTAAAANAVRPVAVFHAPPPPNSSPPPPANEPLYSPVSIGPEVPRKLSASAGTPNPMAAALATLASAAAASVSNAASATSPTLPPRLPPKRAFSPPSSPQGSPQASPALAARTPSKVALMPPGKANSSPQLLPPLPPAPPAQDTTTAAASSNNSVPLVIGGPPRSRSADEGKPAHPSQSAGMAISQSSPPQTLPEKPRQPPVRPIHSNSSPADHPVAKSRTAGATTSSPGEAPESPTKPVPRPRLATMPALSTTKPVHNSSAASHTPKQVASPVPPRKPARAGVA
eukprot:m.169876 g.169876  ORF g.169876 m.169876 type:complete len:782 (-) comp17247_c0_seq12:1411-3756(-)